MRRPSNSPSLNYTIRGVPPEVDRALRERATQRNQSLNHVVIEELTRALLGSPIKADFSDLVGKWTSDTAFDEMIASQRQINIDRWQDNTRNQGPSA